MPGRIIAHKIPSSHARRVEHGMSGSSKLATAARTSGYGESSSTPTTTTQHSFESCHIRYSTHRTTKRPNQDWGRRNPRLTGRQTVGWSGHWTDTVRGRGDLIRTMLSVNKAEVAAHLRRDPSFSFSLKLSSADPVGSEAASSGASSGMAPRSPGHSR